VILVNRAFAEKIKDNYDKLFVELHFIYLLKCCLGNVTIRKLTFGPWEQWDMNFLQAAIHSI